MGAKYIREGDFPRALKHLDKAAELLPAHPQVWNHIGLAWHGSSQPAKAAEAYQRALRIDQRLGPAHFNLGMLLLEQGRVQDAIIELNTFVSLEPTNSMGFSKLGSALMQLKRVDAAERALSQALRLNPKDPEAHNSMGMIHLQRKRPREAMLAFNAALQNRPGFSAALLNQAIVAQQHFGNYQLALERYRAFLETSKNPRELSDVRLIVARLEEVSRTKAEDVASLLLPNKVNAPPPPVTNETPVNSGIAAAPKTNPIAPATNIVSVKTNAPQAKVEETNQLASAASAPPAVTNQPPPEPEPEPELVVPVQVVEVSAEPEFKAPTDLPPAQTNETRLAAARPTEPPLLAPRRERTNESKPGLLDRANPMRWFRSEEKTAPPPNVRAASSSPEERAAPKTIPPQFSRYAYQKKTTAPQGNRAEAERFFVQGARSHQEQRLPAAIEAYRQAVVADPGYFDAQYNLGLAAFQLKDLPLALAANEAAVQLKSQSVDARYHFAMTLRDANYPVDAAHELRTLLAEAPDEPRAHLALANLYAQILEEPALAQQHYRRVIEIAPNHPDAPAIRQWLAAHR